MGMSLQQMPSSIECGSNNSCSSVDVKMAIIEGPSSFSRMLENRPSWASPHNRCLVQLEVETTSVVAQMM